MAQHATVNHASFRVFTRARTDLNRSLTAILVALRLGRYELQRLPRSQRDVLLGTYYEHEIADIGHFNYRASEAVGHMELAERDVAYMAVPYATSLYEDYLTDLAKLASREGHGTVPARAGAVKLHKYLARAGIALPAKESTLFEGVRTIRNCIAHAAGIADADAAAAVAAIAASADASKAWKRIAKTDVPTFSAGERILLSGRDALVSQYVVAQCARAANRSSIAVLGRSTWADLAVLDMRTSYPGRWHRRLTDPADVRREADRHYRVVSLTDPEIQEAILRAPHQRRLP